VELGEEPEPKEVQAIQTLYAGCHFRSRTEARWAVFFDAIGLEWEYEVEGYELPSGRYLPDFFLPTLNVWFEVKGKPLSHDSNQVTQMHDLVKATSRTLYLAEGYIPRDISDLADGRDFMWMFGEGSGDNNYLFCLCIHCGQVGIEYAGRSGRIRCCINNEYELDTKNYNYDDPRLVAAYMAARSARFEFGQSGVAA
jgi:hypothetical protein